MREESSGKLGASGGKSMLDGQEAATASPRLKLHRPYFTVATASAASEIFFSQAAYFLACFDYAINYAMAKNFFAQT